MQSFFDSLSSSERRLVVGVGFIISHSQHGVCLAKVQGLGRTGQPDGSGKAKDRRLQSADQSDLFPIQG